MSIYTKKGDDGRTSLIDGISVSKSDDRIELLGTIDEPEQCDWTGKGHCRKATL